MAQGKRTDIETKANIVIDKINNPDLSVRDLAQKYEVWKSTVWDIIENDLQKYLDNNPDVAKIYYSKIEWLWIDDIKWDNNLNIDKDILSEYLEFVWWYKEAKEYIEWFMLQSLWKWYIRRKALNKNTRYSILERAWFKCQACWAKPNNTNDVELEIDHIIPHSMWGLCVDNNYQVLCMQCNVSKWNKFIHNHNKYEG